ncbi:CRISPR-associated CARF protein Csx1 [Stygiolobus caldivivus]|uniref:CRISPR-associated protein n=1 Tax=Stygiolobus caldivivus TaxID=2824673 RepID=A0A8D5U4E6_9CREN|nr:CRISPR-associated CARF protein Csx1 [Stygiolobus caldivivus]BCU68857.1 CRISPR-associated protein [Stygiolobus caldivivus]
MKVLFAPIGDPKNYEQVNYIIDSKTLQTNASFKAIEQALDVDDVIVYAGLSLCKPPKDYNTCFENISTDVKQKLNLDKEKVIVAPNIFGSKFIQADRKNTLYYNFIYYNTLKILEEEKPDEVYIDITHGINYMPLLATDAIKLATYTYVVEKGEDKLRLTIFDSEPVIRGNPGPYNIDKVFEGKVYMRQAVLFIVTPFLSSENKSNVKKAVGKTCDTDLIYSLANALFSGIFPYIVLSRDEVKKCLDGIEGEIKVLDHKDFIVKIQLDNDVLTYKTVLPIEISYVHSLLTAINGIVRGINTINYGGSEWVSLEDIESLAKKFSSSETISAVVRNEVDKLKSVKVGESPQLLAEVLDGEKPRKKCSADERNLFAHGGFEKNVTYLLGKDGKTYVSYVDCKGEVKNHLK